MRSRQWRCNTWTILIVFAVELGLASAGTVFAGDAVDICHFQEESDSWKILSVGQPAIRAHLENHDDAKPGGTTTHTGTLLDANCIPVEETSCDVPGGSCTVFVTSQVFNSDLGGLEGADQKCQDLADAAELDGIFKAWLSDSTTDARDRLTQASVPYVLVDGLLVAMDFVDLTDGVLENQILVDETGAIRRSSVYTSTEQDGVGVSVEASYYCGDWQSVGPVPLVFAFGINFDDNNPGDWTFNASSGCVNEQRLYCFEQ